MSTVGEILTVKGGKVHTIGAKVTVLEATQIMNRHQIGALVVTEDGENVAGIFTERDVLRRVVAEQRDPATTTIGDVMTRKVACTRPDSDLQDVTNLMRNQRIRHVPVVDEQGKLLGLISIGDVNAHHANDREVHIHYLHEYFYGRV